jgi:hypothetical protein
MLKYRQLFPKTSYPTKKNKTYYEKTDKKRALQLILAAMPCYNKNLKGLI